MSVVATVKEYVYILPTNLAKDITLLFGASSQERWGLLDSAFIAFS
jgi:hypothetical protein